MPSSGEVVGSSELVTYFMKIGQSVSPIYGNGEKAGLETQEMVRKAVSG